MLRRTISFLLLSIAVFCKAGNLDSLKAVLQKTKDDTIRCVILEKMVESEPNEKIWMLYNDEEYKIAQKLILSDNARMVNRGKTFLAASLSNVGFMHANKGEMDLALEIFEKCLKINLELNNPFALSLTYNNLGGVCKRKGEVMKGLEYYKKSLEIEQKLGNKKGIARQMNNIGFTYNSQGDIPKALDHFQQSLKIFEELGDKSGIANVYNNLADIYRSQQDIEKALEYHQKSLMLREEIGDKAFIAISLNNLGGVYSLKGQNDKALDHYKRSLMINEELGHKRMIAKARENIGSIYVKEGKVDDALEQFKIALKIRREIGDKEGLTQSMNDISYIYTGKKNYTLARVFADSSLLLSKELGFPSSIMNAEYKLYQLESAAKDPKAALQHYEQYILFRDSVSNATTRKASIKKQLQMEYEKQAAADSVAFAKEGEIKSAELSRQAAEIKAKKNQQYALFGGLFLVGLFSIFMFNRYKITQKQKIVIERQKKIVEEQKKLVEEKQKEVLESIHYAKRIQLAQIPSEKMVWSMITRTARK
jgi:tetratricopeptide (TPR) repeat protein